MDKKVFAIAIDGPVACGKGTIALLLANSLQGFYLSTGAMYRAAAWYCLENKISVDDETAIATVLKSVTIAFNNTAVLLNNVDISEKIRNQGVANAASVIAMFPKVRQMLVFKQQQIAKEMLASGKIVVAEGRDTGTKVFPDAPFKVFLTASQEVRTARRFAQYKQEGQEVTQEEVLAQIADRDKRDMERITDPLPKNPASLGYFVLDNSNLSAEQTLEVIVSELEKRGLIS